MGTVMDNPYDRMGLPRSFDLGPGRPIEALDMHLAQWEFSHTSLHLRLTERLTRGSFDPARGYNATPAFYARAESEMLNAARTVFVRPEITGEVVVRAEREPSALQHHDLPEDCGFVIFGEPVPYIDYDEDTVLSEGPEALSDLPLRAIAWRVVDSVTTQDATGVPGIAIWCYTDCHGDLADRFRAEGHSAPPLLLVDLHGWAFDLGWAVGDWALPEQWDSSVQRPHVAGVRLILVALWEFMAEYVWPMRPPRPQSRRWERSGVQVPQDGDVKIVHLRKYRPGHRIGEQEVREVEWSHRWWVRGHWAWRACKCHPEGRHRVYIDPYVKGPEYAPLIAKEKVVSVER